MRERPVATSVAAISNSMGEFVRSFSKSMLSDNSRRSGSKPSGLNSYGDHRLAICAICGARLRP